MECCVRAIQHNMPMAGLAVRIKNLPHYTHIMRTMGWKAFETLQKKLSHTWREEESRKKKKKKRKKVQ